MIILIDLLRFQVLIFYEFYISLVKFNNFSELGKEKVAKFIAFKLRLKLKIYQNSKIKKYIF